MKSLTYGTLPSLIEFQRAFFANQGTTDTYDIHCNDSDARMFESTGIEPYSTRYTCESLYALLEALVEVYYSGYEGPKGPSWWAGDFASSILTTLGFSWV